MGSTKGEKTDPPYPMDAIGCNYCGFVCTVFERVGTGCSYIIYCPSCGVEETMVVTVRNKEEHKETIDRFNEQKK